MTQEIIFFNEYLLTTPLGELAIWLDKSNILQFVGWVEHRALTQQQLTSFYKTKTIKLQLTKQSNPVIQAISEYFQGKLNAINKLIVADFGSPFQKQVWQALRQIPAGTTCSYSEIAKQLGNPLACRAVGMANHNNPIAIVVPCHRVIGKNKKLTGYAGGLEKKQWLLAHEKHFTYHDLLALT